MSTDSLKSEVARHTIIVAIRKYYPHAPRSEVDRLTQNMVGALEVLEYEASSASEGILESSEYGVKAND